MKNIFETILFSIRVFSKNLLRRTHLKNIFLYFVLLEMSGPGTCNVLLRIQHNFYLLRGNHLQNICLYFILLKISDLSLEPWPHV